MGIFSVVDEGDVIKINWLRAAKTNNKPELTAAGNNS